LANALATGNQENRSETKPTEAIPFTFVVILQVIAEAIAETIRMNETDIVRSVVAVKDVQATLWPEIRDAKSTPLASAPKQP